MFDSAARILSVTFCLTALACTVTRPANPDLAGRDVRLTILHTSDIHSRIFPYQAVVNRFDKELGLDPDACGCKLASPSNPNPTMGSGKPICCDNNGALAKTCGDTLPPGYYRARQCNIGGAARIATILQRERAQTARHLYLDSGDVFQGGPVFNVFLGEAEMKMMGRLNIDAMVFGNHEIDRGATNLYLQLKKLGTFPFIAANYQFDDFHEPTRPKLGEFVKPYEIFNLEGLRVGVIGMGNQSSLNSLVEGGNSLGIRPLDTNYVIKTYIAVLRPQVDVLILLSHMGLDEDEGLAAQDVHDSEAQQLEDISDGVDVIMGGHLHIVLNPPKVVPRASGRPTIISHSGAFAKFVGRLDLVVHKKGPDDPEGDPGSQVKAFDYHVFAVDESVPQDPAMEQMLEPYELELNRRIDLTRKFAFIPGTTVVRNDPSGGDSQLGNLVTASMRFRERVEADFAVTNSLGIRADFNSGPLDLEQMFNVFPFENSIAVMYLSGNEIQEMLDFVAFKSSERGCRAQAQVSGIWFDMVCRSDFGTEDGGDGALGGRCRDNGVCNLGLDCRPAPDGQPRCAVPPHAENIFIGDSCGPCRPETSGGYTPGTCGCRTLDPFQSYRVAVNDYIAAGGSGFTVLKRNTTKQNTGISLRDALVDYIQRKIDHCPAECLNDDGSSVGSFSCVTPPMTACKVGSMSPAPTLVPVEGHDGRINAVQ